MSGDTKQDLENLRLLQSAGFAFGSVADMKAAAARWKRSSEEDNRTIWPGHDWAPGCANLPPAGEKGDW